VHFLEPPADLKQPVLRAAGARVTMTPAELAVFGAWSGTDAELNDWFFGRMLAKDACRAAWTAKHGEAIFPADLETSDAHGRIACAPRGEPKPEPLPPVRVAHCEGKVAAVSAFAERLGIALVALPKNASPEAERAAREAAVRAALADALAVPLEACALEALTAEGAVVRAGGSRYRASAAIHKGAVLATTVCEGA
jgi:hypothetical protein